MSRLLIAAAAAVITIASQGAALAGRVPDAAELTKIENALRSEGFTRWGTIESDDNDRTWEVDDAYANDGAKYDLELDAQSLKIIRRDRD